MASRVNLTDRIKEVCIALVSEHARQESHLFEHVWGAVWRSLQCQRMEDLATGAAWHPSSRPITELGAIDRGSGQALDTLFIVGAIIDATASILRNSDRADLTTAGIDEAISTGAERVGAPLHVRRLLGRYATGLLAEQLGATDWQDATKPPEPVQQFRLRVDWCEEARATEEAETHSELFESVDVEKRFEANKKKYTLYVDERSLAVYVHTGRRSLRREHPVPWSVLQTRHRILLGLILQAFRGSRMIRYEVISRDGAFFESLNAVNPWVSVQRTKSQLDKMLQGILKKTVRSVGGSNCYEIREQISYCWTRPNGEPSRLSS